MHEHATDPAEERRSDLARVRKCRIQTQNTSTAMDFGFYSRKVPRNPSDSSKYANGAETYLIVGRVSLTKVFHNLSSSFWAISSLRASACVKVCVSPASSFR